MELESYDSAYNRIHAREDFGNLVDGRVFQV